MGGPLTLKETHPRTQVKKTTQNFTQKKTLPIKALQIGRYSTFGMDNQLNRPSNITKIDLTDLGKVLRF